MKYLKQTHQNANIVITRLLNNFLSIFFPATNRLTRNKIIKINNQLYTKNKRVKVQTNINAFVVLKKSKNSANTVRVFKITTAFIVKNLKMVQYFEEAAFIFVFQDLNKLRLQLRIYFA